MLEAWKIWLDLSRDETLRNTPPIISWGVWLACKKATFRDALHVPQIIASEVATIFALIPREDQSHVLRIVHEEEIIFQMPWSYFDGTTSNEDNISGEAVTPFKLALAGIKQFRRTSISQATIMLGPRIKLQEYFWLLNECN